MPRLSVSVDNELKFDDEVITGIVVGVPVFVSFETRANKIEYISLNGVIQTFSNAISLTTTVTSHTITLCGNGDAIITGF